MTWKEEVGVKGKDSQSCMKKFWHEKGVFTLLSVVMVLLMCTSVQYLII